MSTEPGNVELLHEAIAAYNRGDLSFVHQRAADDIEVHGAPGLVNAGTHHGRPAFERWMQEWLEAWSDFTIEVRGVEEVDGRFLVVDVHQMGVGSESGIPVEMEIVQLVEVHDGEVTRLHLYPERADALATLERLRAGDTERSPSP